MINKKVDYLPNYLNERLNKNPDDELSRNKKERQ